MALVLGTLLSSGVFAQDDSSGEVKIAILDMAAALFNSKQAQLVNEQVIAETQGDQEKIRELATEAQALQEELQQNAAVMSEDDQRRKAQSIQELANQYDFLVKQNETYVQQKQQEFQNTYATILIQVINELIEEGGYDMVLRSEAVLFHENAYDITALVTERLNEQ